MNLLFTLSAIALSFFWGVVDATTPVPIFSRYRYWGQSTCGDSGEPITAQDTFLVQPGVCSTTYAIDGGVSGSIFVQCSAQVFYTYLTHDCSGFATSTSFACQVGPLGGNDYISYNCSTVVSRNLLQIQVFNDSTCKNPLTSKFLMEGNEANKRSSWQYPAYCGSWGWNANWITFGTVDCSPVCETYCVGTWWLNDYPGSTAFGTCSPGIPGALPAAQQYAIVSGTFSWPPTSSPTSSPTGGPSSIPSISPTGSRPTFSPSKTPSKSPSSSPTPPTSAPTSFEAYMNEWPTSINSHITYPQFVGTWFALAILLVCALLFIGRQIDNVIHLYRTRQLARNVQGMSNTTRTSPADMDVMVLDLANVDKIDARTFESNKSKIHLSSVSLEKCCAVSWKWPNAKQMSQEEVDNIVRDILEFAVDLGYSYAWIDRGCLPQDPNQFSIDMIIESSVVYDNIPVFMVSLTEHFDPDLIYLTRLWCNMELYRALITNPTANGFVSIVPTTFSLPKLCRLVKHVFHVIEVGGGNPATLDFGPCSYRDIVKLLAHPVGNTMKLLDASGYSHGALLTINVKALGTEYRIGLAKMLHRKEIQCAKETDIPLAAALLLQDEKLIKLRHDAASALPKDTRLPLFLAMCESGLQVQGTEVAEFCQAVNVMILPDKIVVVGVIHDTSLVVDIGGKYFYITAGNGAIGLLRVDEPYQHLSRRVSGYEFGVEFIVRDVARGRVVFFGSKDGGMVDLESSFSRPSGKMLSQEAVLVLNATQNNAGGDDILPVLVPSSEWVKRFDGLGVDVVVEKSRVLSKPSSSTNNFIPGIAFDTSCTVFFNDFVARFCSWLFGGGFGLPDRPPLLHGLLLALPNRLSGMELNWLLEQLTVPRGAPFTSINNNTITITGGGSARPHTNSTGSFLDQAQLSKYINQNVQVNEGYSKVLYMGNFVLMASQGQLSLNVVELLGTVFGINVIGINLEDGTDGGNLALTRLKLGLVTRHEELVWNMTGDEAKLLTSPEGNFGLKILGVEKGVLVFGFGGDEASQQVYVRSVPNNNNAMTVCLTKFTGVRSKLMTSDDATVLEKFAERILVEGYKVVERNFRGVIIEGKWGRKPFNAVANAGG